MTTLTLPETGTWTLDPTHTEINFMVRHLVAAKVRGHFRTIDGAIAMGESPETS